MSSVQDENVTTRVRVEPERPRAAGPTRRPNSKAIRLRLFKD